MFSAELLFPFPFSPFLIQEVFRKNLFKWSEFPSPAAETATSLTQALAFNFDKQGTQIMIFMSVLLH